jgi:hypothetical protein
VYVCIQIYTYRHERICVMSHAILLTLVREGFCRPAEEGDEEEVNLCICMYTNIHVQT